MVINTTKSEILTCPQLNIIDHRPVPSQKPLARTLTLIPCFDKQNTLSVLGHAQFPGYKCSYFAGGGL